MTANLRIRNWMILLRSMMILFGEKDAKNESLKKLLFAPPQRRRTSLQKRQEKNQSTQESKNKFCASHHLSQLEASYSNLAHNEKETVPHN